jgi:hypothetical protein
MKYAACFVIALAMAVVPLPASAGQSLPQTPPGAPPTEARPDFSGTWTLDRSISGDPSKASFEPAQAPSRQRPGGFGGGRRGGIGGARPADRNPADVQTPDERARLQALTDQLRNGSSRLVISHHDPTFVINDALDHTQFFQTSDSPANQDVGPVTIVSTTHWESSRLVTEYTLSSREHLVFTYTVLAATKQMVLRVRLDDTERRRTIGRELKLVYTLAPPQPG